jgi:hypothetical protein
MKVKAKPRPFSEEEDQFIRKNYLTVPTKRISKLLGRSEGVARRRLKVLGLVVPPEIVEKFKQDSRIKPGSVPPNKGKKQTDYMTPDAIAKTVSTRFKKGDKVPTELYDGCITIRETHKDRGGAFKPHWYIRLSKGIWQELQIFCWEQENGPVPKGHILACQDGDTLNCHTSNWKLMTKQQNAIRNSGVLNLPDKLVARYIVGKNGSEELHEEITKQTDLIEAKRQQILLNRKIKSIKQRQS